MQAIEQLRRLGFEIEAAGDQVRVRHQNQPQPEALPLLEYIRQHKTEVLAALSEPPSAEKRVVADDAEQDSDLLDGIVADAPPVPPSLPTGVRLVSYAPQKPPVAIEHCSIVTNVGLFIQSSLADLEARLNRPKVARCGWTVPQILDRLRQVGLVLEVEKTAARKSGE